jgi:hypothetical protein
MKLATLASFSVLHYTYWHLLQGVRSPAMEQLLSAIVSDLISRALSMAIQMYRRSKAEQTEQKLHSVLLRIDATVEEAEGRYITNHAMLRQLEMLRQGMYQGHYMLDTIRYRCHGEDDVSGGGAVALPRFSPANLFFPFLVTSNKENLRNTTIDAETVKKLEKMLHSLEMLMGGMEEFALFLKGYPRICSQPYSNYLILDKVMFGRQMEKETVLNFLLRPDSAGDGKPGVLPIVGLARVGKSTLVEHVCLDERVRSYFSSIIVFTGGNLNGANMTALRNSGVIKHQDLTVTNPSCGRSLVVIELDGDMEEETWKRLCSSAASVMGQGSKIIVTGRSEKITHFGTTQSMRLKFLPQEAYWYFFRTIAFGSTDPNDHPKLASLCMEIALDYRGSFMAANIVGGLLRANMNTHFWRKCLRCVRDSINKHLLMFGEHPVELMLRDQPLYISRMSRTPQTIMVCKVYQDRSFQHAVPKLTLQDIVAGCAADQAEFRTVAWRSSVPPCYTYLASCVSQTDRYSMVSRKRPRREGLI